MSSTSIFSTASRLTLFVAATFATVACAGRVPVNTAAVPAPAASVAEVVAPAQSIFDLESTWKSQDGITARLSTLRGGLLVVGLVSTDCAAPCPATVNAMKTIERSTDPAVHFVLVTLDPQKDTPEVLAAFAKAKGLSADRYTIVSGSAQATTELAAVLNRNTTAQGLASNSTLSVIDGNGVLVLQRGNGNVSEAIEALHLLSTISH